MPQEALQQVSPFLHVVEPHFSPSISRLLGASRLSRTGFAKALSASVVMSTTVLIENECIEADSSQNDTQFLTARSFGCRWVSEENVSTRRGEIYRQLPECQRGDGITWNGRDPTPTTFLATNHSYQGVYLPSWARWMRSPDSGRM